MLNLENVKDERKLTLEVESFHISELIEEIINDSRTSSVIVPNIEFHHNRSYRNTPSAIKNGILSLSELNKKGIIKLNEEELKKFNLDDHVNGINHVSIASTNIDYKKMYSGEEVYSPYRSSVTDILVSSEIKKRRVATHYYNEFLVPGGIQTEEFRAIDIRILKEIEEVIINRKDKLTHEKTQLLIDKYNYLKIIANALIESNLDIPLREMSNENITLDLDKIAKSPTLVLK